MDLMVLWGYCQFRFCPLLSIWASQGRVEADDTVLTAKLCGWSAQSCPLLFAICIINYQLLLWSPVKHAALIFNDLTSAIHVVQHRRRWTTSNDRSRRNQHWRAANPKSRAESWIGGSMPNDVVKLYLSTSATARSTVVFWISPSEALRERRSWCSFFTRLTRIKNLVFFAWCGSSLHSSFRRVFLPRFSGDMLRLGVPQLFPGPTLQSPECFILLRHFSPLGVERSRVPWFRQHSPLRTFSDSHAFFHCRKHKNLFTRLVYFLAVIPGMLMLTGMYWCSPDTCSNRVMMAATMARAFPP